MKKNCFLILAIMLPALIFSFSANAEEYVGIAFYENCGIEYDGTYILGIPENTTVSEVVERLSGGNPFFCNNAKTLEGSDLVGTGTELFSTMTYEEGSKGTIIVKGDVSGDGRLTSQDYLLVRKTFSGEKNLSTYAFLAADINGDSKIKSADYLALKRFFQGGPLINTSLVDMPEGNGIVLLEPADGSEAEIANKLVKTASRSSSFDTATFNKLNPDHTDVFRSEGVRVSWLSKTKGATVRISENSNMSDYTDFETESNTYYFRDLFAGTDYFYQIISKDRSSVTPITKFTTAFQPRTIDIFGISNTRDIGGWITEDGTKRIKQGILYRGEGTSKMTEKGMKDFTEKYGIRTDLSLSGSDVSSLLKDKTDVHYCEILTYGNMYSCDQKYLDNFRNALLLLTDESNFPIYFHCYIGRDRTATFAATVLALCGVKKNDIKKEYCISFLAESGWRDGNGPSAMMPHFNTYLDPLGTDIQTSIRQYLKNKVGLTDEQMDRIVENCTVNA